MPTINQRAQVAADPATSEADLREYARDASPKVRAAVGGNPSTPATVLAVLADDAKSDVRYAVAVNPAPTALAVSLAAARPDVRSHAAQRDDIGPDQLRSLAEDPDHSVRQTIAEVCHDPVVAATLARDPHPTVRGCVVLNRGLTPDDVEMLAGDPIANVRANVAASRRLRPATLTRLAEDRSALVRFAVLSANHDRTDLAAKLVNDPDKVVADTARHRIEHPEHYSEPPLDPMSPMTGREVYDEVTRLVPDLPDELREQLRDSFDAEPDA